MITVSVSRGTRYPVQLNRRGMEDLLGFSAGKEKQSLIEKQFRVKIRVARNERLIKSSRGRSNTEERASSATFYIKGDTEEVMRASTGVCPECIDDGPS